MKTSRLVGMAVIVGVAGAGLLVAGPCSARAKVHGMRVDPAYLLHVAGAARGDEASFAADALAADAAAMRVDTLFVYAYSPRSGAYYRAKQPGTDVEPRLGAQDVLGRIVAAAHGRGIRVVAWLPLTNFERVWDEHADWRSKRTGGEDYLPGGGVHLLSAWHPAFRAWYEGFLEDLLVAVPELDGIEAAEAFVDHAWDDAADYNPAAWAAFQVEHPMAGAGGADWRDSRAHGLTSLHGIMARTAHRHGKTAWVVQTWTPEEDCSGRLVTSEALRDRTGFDFDGILNLPGEQRPDYVSAELIWQEWTDRCGVDAVKAGWTRKAAKAFVARVAARATAIVHVELTPAKGVEPTVEQFGDALGAALEEAGGAEFYDYKLVKERGSEAIVKAVFAK